MDAHGAYLERELARGPWCLGDQYSVADMYLYMLVGWESYIAGGYQLGGERVREHYRRVGERPAVVRARELRRSRRAPHPLPPGAARGPADLTAMRAAAIVAAWRSSM